MHIEAEAEDECAVDVAGGAGCVDTKVTELLTLTLTLTLTLALALALTLTLTLTR